MIIAIDEAAILKHPAALCAAILPRGLHVGSAAIVITVMPHSLATNAPRREILTLEF
jgi:hypothetical protein